jgi:hypothetical protein
LYNSSICSQRSGVMLIDWRVTLRIMTHQAPGAKSVCRTTHPKAYLDRKNWRQRVLEIFRS